MTSVQMLRSSDSLIWIPAMVLQQSFNILPHENPQQDAKKSYHLDLRGIQNFSLGRHQSPHGHYSN